MLKILNTFCLVLICSSLFAQSKQPKKLSKKQLDLLYETSSYCLHRNKYTAVQRRSFYPFNKATKISLISFRDTTSQYLSRLPVKKGVLDTEMVREETRLSVAETDKLTDLFFNYGYKSKKYSTVSDPSGCYQPHNAILFFDDNRKVLDYIEICFDCQNTRYSSNQISMGEGCIEKFSMLKDFFTSHGIKFISLYPKEE